MRLETVRSRHKASQPDNFETTRPGKAVHPVRGGQSLPDDRRSGESISSYTRMGREYAGPLRHHCDEATHYSVYRSRKQPPHSLLSFRTVYCRSPERGHIQASVSHYPHGPAFPSSNSTHRVHTGESPSCTSARCPCDPRAPPGYYRCSGTQRRR